MSNSGRNGVILLGYARSAGSGDQPVPGTVTSRRDRGQKQLQEKKKLAQQEEERKLRARQELAAQFLKRKWKEEEKKRRKGVEDRSESGDEAETSAPPVENERNPPRHVERGPVQEGKWVSKEEENLRFLQDNARSREAPRSGIASTSLGTAGAEPPAKVDSESQKKRKKALASAFGMDDDDDEARRELELAARVKRQRVDSRVPPHGSQSDAGAAIGTPAVGGVPSLGGTSMDMYEQLRKLAEWKRACKGNRRPMPDDMVAAIAATAGISHADEAPPPTSSSSSSRRRRSPSRSRSRGRRKDSRR